MTTPAPADTELQGRARGTLLAAAAGDALGWPIEPRGRRIGGSGTLEPQPRFVAWRRGEGGGFAPHEEEIPAGTYSDDTQLMIAVARSLLRTEWWKHLTEVELPLWLLYEMGGGGAIRRAAQGWLRARTPWAGVTARVESYFEAGANGAAMRVAPHAVRRAHERTFTGVRKAVLADALTTHGHPRAILGAQLFAYGCWTAMRRREPLAFGELIDRCLVDVRVWSSFDENSPPPAWAAVAPKGYSATWEATVEEIVDLLNVGREGLSRGALAVDHSVLEQLGCFGPHGGSGTITAAAALFLASRHASQPRQGLVAAAFARRADTDTLAAMSGALLGAIHGEEWLGQLSDAVQDHDYLSDLADQLLNRDTPAQSYAPWRMHHRKRLFDRLEELSLGQDLAVPVFESLVLREAHEHPTRAAQRIRSWRLRSNDGQTIRIKRFTKLPVTRQETLSFADASTARVGGSRDLPIRDGSRSEQTSTRTVMGYVLQVPDLVRSLAFYSKVLGMRIVRHNGRSASFGWLALEQDLTRRALPRPDELESAGAITLFLEPEAFETARSRLAANDVATTDFGERHGRRAFRCTDPDGNPVELRERESASDSPGHDSNGD
ncbi:MAG: ADP-ribosylglycohydrolase family protein [Thermoleophilaceae bacterium]